jgi:hypothetical protein
MKITRTVYYCVYTRNNDTLFDYLPQYSTPFETEEAARVEAKKLIQQGYFGTIERHHQAKQDYENDYAWLPDLAGVGTEAITLLDHF